MNENIANWITQPEQADVFEWLATNLAAGRSEISLQKNLRSEHGPEKAQAVLQLHALRLRAEKRFPRAKDMFFTDESLQQATTLDIANFKANRFVNASRIQDWCCGIGGDLIALAGCNAECIGVDHSQTLCRFARKNLDVFSRSAEICCDDVEQFKWDANDFLHIDPARRVNGRRTTRLEHYRPGEGFLEQLINRSRGAAIKLAPATQVPDPWRENCELQWVGNRSECKQLVCWSGELAKTAGKSSVAIVDGETVTEWQEPEHPEFIPSARTRTDAFLYEPHSAFIAGHLVSRLAQTMSLEIMNSRPVMMTGPQLIDTRLCQAFRVLQESSVQPGRLRADLQSLKPGHLEFKCRPPFDKIESIRNKMKLDGDRRLTVIAIRVQEKPRVLICERAVR